MELIERNLHTDGFILLYAGNALEAKQWGLLSRDASGDEDTDVVLELNFSLVHFGITYRPENYSWSIDEAKLIVDEVEHPLNVEGNTLLSFLTKEARAIEEAFYDTLDHNNIKNPQPMSTL